MSTVVVTGTSSGIGLATAVTLARVGHIVFAGMRNLDRSDELREVISKESLSIKIVQLDVDDDNSVEGGFKQILKEANLNIRVAIVEPGVVATPVGSPLKCALDQRRPARPRARVGRGSEERRAMPRPRRAIRRFCDQGVGALGPWDGLSFREI
jgi:NAD(P)-dependent dehydrogenase (short-subunit alcohol dehydrogenase family)